LELKEKLVDIKLTQYKQKYLHRVSRMEDIGYPKQPVVTQSSGWPLKRQDGYSHEEGTGHLLA
jgi:hypothetical protein